MTAGVYERFRRFAKARLGFRLDESDGNALTAPLSQEESEAMVAGFGMPESVDDGGWILPDGSVLDLGRSDITGRAVRHGEVFRYMSPGRRSALMSSGLTEKDLVHGNETPVVDSMLTAGCVRYHATSTRFGDVCYCSVEVEPTSNQLSALRDIEEFVSRNMSAGEFRGIVECAGRRFEYDDPKEFGARFANDVMSCYA